MELISNVNDFINNIIWGIPMILLILGTGIYYTIKLGFPQFTKIKQIYNLVCSCSLILVIKLSLKMLSIR